MLDKLGRIFRGCWTALGVGSDLQGRVGFLVFATFSVLGIFAGLSKRLGTVTAVIVAVCAVGALTGLWLAVAGVRREEKCRELRRVNGTLIPPGYAAIVTGAQAEPGEWMPPGFEVTMGQGFVSDGLGNTVSGADSRVYNGRDNTVMGAGSRVGEKPY